ncbi:hypothetical protein JVU11DRAFT_11761 [Chiua virens]|nr:hypothetical protein JVU11DRAFT_11761 [Chiua virens]
MDNTLNNDSCMQHLECLLESRDIHFDVHDHQIRCFPHIINICIRHILDRFMHSAVEKIAEAWVDLFPDSTGCTHYATTVQNKPIKKGCSIATAICSSGLHHDKFAETIKHGNARNWFQAPGSGVQVIPNHELKLAADTRSLTSFKITSQVKGYPILDCPYHILNFLCLNGNSFERIDPDSSHGWILA